MVEQRTSLGLSQRELAAMRGIPQSSVARIESCKTTPNLGTLLNIFQHLGLQLTVRPTNLQFEIKETTILTCIINIPFKHNPVDNCSFITPSDIKIGN